MRFRSLFVSILMMLLLLTSSSTVFAANDTKNTESGIKASHTVSINEYNYLKNLKQKSNTKLKSMGFDDEKIKALNNFDFKQELIKRSKLSTDTLKSLGYTDDKISLLRNFKGTEPEMQALSSTVYITDSIDNYYYISSSNKTLLDTKLSWNWDSCPFWEWTDMVAIGWSGGFVQSSTSDSYNYVDVHYKNGQIVSQSWKAQPGQGCSSSFTLPYKNLDSNNWAKQGYTAARAYAPGKVLIVGVNFGYGHTIITPSFSVTWALTGGSFSFGTSMQTTSDYISLNL